MEEYLERLASELSLDKLVSILLGIIFIISMVNLMKKSLSEYVKEKSSWMIRATSKKGCSKVHFLKENLLKMMIHRIA